MYKKCFKRILDFLISLAATPFVLLVIAVMAPIIYISDPGPVFYNAERRGKNGKSFKMYKLRSMYVNAPDIRNSDGSTFNSSNDPRVTKIGRLMRKTSLDELPQILNVLKGDMSFIGPRPTLTTKNYDEIPESIKKRFEIRPGITGYSQAYFRNSATQEEKFEQDNYYVDNMTFLLDIKIFLKTVISVVKHENIFVSAEEVPADSAGREEVLNK